MRWHPFPLPHTFACPYRGNVTTTLFFISAAQAQLAALASPPQPPATPSYTSRSAAECCATTRLHQTSGRECVVHLLFPPPRHLHIPLARRRLTRRHSRSCLSRDGLHGTASTASGEGLGTVQRPGYVSECCRISTAPRTPLPFGLARATHWVGRVGNHNLRHVACRSTLSVAGGRRLVQLELAGERCVDGADVDGFERMCERLKELQRLCDSWARSAQGRGPEGRRSKTDLVACCESLERCPLIHCSAHKRLSSAFVSM